MKFLICIFALFLPAVAMADIASTLYTDNALSVKADDSAVVHKTGAETISGTKTFTGTINSTVSDKILKATNVGLSNYAGNPYVGLISNGNGGYLAFLQGVGTTADDARLYLGPTSTKAMSFRVSDGAISMPNTLTVAKTITVGTDVATTSDSNQVATTKWTNDKIDAARGVIPVGENGTDVAQIWIE